MNTYFSRTVILCTENERHIRRWRENLRRLKRKLYQTVENNLGDLSITFPKTLYQYQRENITNLCVVNQNKCICLVKLITGGCANSLQRVFSSPNAVAESYERGRSHRIPMTICWRWVDEREEVINWLDSPHGESTSGFFKASWWLIQMTTGLRDASRSYHLIPRR